MPTSKTVNLKLWRQNFERVAAVQGEDKARVLSMVISEREGVPFDMSGYTAEIYMHEANGRDVTLPAEIDGSIVTAVIPLITAAGDAAIQVILTKSTGEILKVAGIVLDVQPSELENAVDGSDEFNLLVGVTKQAEKAAGDALEAADIALEAADSVKARADSGEFNGEKGDTGPEGPQGVSGVYVGSGDMPEGYTVQVDPTGDMLCYTAGESDSRYLRATEIRRPFTGGGITLTDADDAAFGGVTVLGATTEAGTGDKGPDNPYALTGVQPTKVTACGRNLIPYPYTSLPSTVTGISFADNGDGTITVNGTAADETAGRLHFLSNLLRIPAGTYTLSGCAANGSGDTWCLQVVRVINGVEDWGWLCREFGAGITFSLAEATDVYVRIRLKKGTVINNGIFKPQLESGPAATPYAPYTGQTVPLPAIAPLWGTGDIRDEYDAVTGVETRRWKRVTLDGTEAWAVSATGTAGKYRVSLSIEDILPTATFSQVSSCRCSHYATISADNTYHLQVGISANYGTSHGIFIYDDAYDVQDVTGWKAYLAAQYAAGTPVTVVYQLAEPVITRYGPQRIPTYPGYTNLMMDISAEGAVQYPISAAMQWDAKADKAAVYDRDTADSRFAGVLTGTASGPVAALEDVSPTGALRRAAVLGATAETGSGDKGPDNPYTLAGVQPTKVTVCGRNLAANPRFNAADQFSPCVYADCELQPNTKYTISLYVPAGEAYYTNENLFAKIVYLPVSTGGIYSAEATTKPTISNTDPKQYATGKGWTLLKAQSGTTASGNARDLQIEFGDTATPYEPYTGQTITLPALEPLYGDGTVNDEYDAVSGVETRRWKRWELNGTENWSTYTSGNKVYYIAGIPDADKAYTQNGSTNDLNCTHFTPPHVYIANYGKGFYIPGTTVPDVADLQTLKAYLAAQAAAGTPVTVVYQLAEPVITQHDPARILPPAPVCRVFADAGNTAVGYNRDVNIVIPKLEAALAELLGGGAQPMT